MLRRLMIQINRQSCGRRSNGKIKMFACGLLVAMTVTRLMFSSMGNEDVETAFKQLNDIEYSQQAEQE